MNAAFVADASVAIAWVHPAQANDETEALEIEEGEEGQTDDDEATDAGYIDPDVPAEIEETE